MRNFEILPAAGGGADAKRKFKILRSATDYEIIA